MVACSQIYIYFQPIQENESENGTGNRNLWGQRLDELIREDCVVEITDGAIKEEVVKISHLIMGEVPLMSHLEKAKIWKVNTRPDLYNDKPKKSNADVALALLESGIIEPIDVLAKAKQVVGASFFTRFALLAQALGFLYAFIARWQQNASISPLESIASYYALVILKRSMTHLLRITYDIRKPLLIHLDIHKMHGVSSHSPLSSQPHPSTTLETLGGWPLCLLLIVVDYVIGGTAGWLVNAPYRTTECEVRQGSNSRILVVPFIFFFLVLLGNTFQVIFPKCTFLKNVRTIFMVVSLSTAIVFTCYSWEGCNYDKRISPKFSLPFFQ